jgi:hypothetical protein
MVAATVALFAATSHSHACCCGSDTSSVAMFKRADSAMSTATTSIEESTEHCMRSQSSPAVCIALPLSYASQLPLTVP